MERVIAALLIPLLAMGSVFPHSQEVSAAHASGGQADRPHIHVGGHSHHHHVSPHGHHSHPEPAEDRDDRVDTEATTDRSDAPPVPADSVPADSVPADSVPADHDSDAVYLVGTPVYVPASTTPKCEPPQILVVAHTHDDGSSKVEFCRQRRNEPISLNGPPRFVLHAALRL